MTAFLLIAATGGLFVANNRPPHFHMKTATPAIMTSDMKTQIPITINTVLSPPDDESGAIGTSDVRSITIGSPVLLEPQFEARESDADRHGLPSRGSESLHSNYVGIADFEGREFVKVGASFLDLI